MLWISICFCLEKTKSIIGSCFEWFIFFFSMILIKKRIRRRCSSKAITTTSDVLNKNGKRIKSICFQSSVINYWLSWNNIIFLRAPYNFQTKISDINRSFVMRYIFIFIQGLTSSTILDTICKESWLILIEHLFITTNKEKEKKRKRKIVIIYQTNISVSFSHELYSFIKISICMKE